jgi:hypothetical protein
MEAAFDLSVNATADTSRTRKARGAWRDYEKQGRCKITNGSGILPGIDGRSPWVRRFKDVIREHLSDKPDATAAEQAIIRRAATLIVELERLEHQFAAAGEADPDMLDLYGRVAGNMRRLLESVGLGRRAKDVTPPLSEYLATQDKVIDAPV